MHNGLAYLKARRNSLAAFALAILGIAVASTTAKADDFGFGITGGVSGGGSGDVSGVILGLSDNSTGPATQVIITGLPASFHSVPGFDSFLGSLPIDATLWNNQLLNSFTETSGQVAFGAFWALETSGPGGPSAGLSLTWLGGPDPHIDSFFFDDGTGVNNISISSADGTVAPVPEPPLLPLLSGLVCLGALVVRRAAVSSN